MSQTTPIYEDGNTTTLPMNSDGKVIYGQAVEADINRVSTEEEVERGLYYAERYARRRGEMNNYKDEWDELAKMFACERTPDPDDPYYPNSFIPLITPVVEGQVASMLESEVEYTYTTNHPSHKAFMAKAEAASAYCREWNQAQRHIKDFARNFDLLGNGWLTTFWEKSYDTAKNKPSGFPRVMVPHPLAVLVDGRIKDYKDLQYAEYIIHEIGFQSIRWARDEFADVPEKVAMLETMNSRYEGSDTPALSDDSDSFLLLHVWTRNNKQKSLQLIEMDSRGLILRQSDPSKPYYAKVHNEYPFYFVRMLPRLGHFHGHGDGKILMEMQRTINNLADEFEIACRYSAQARTFVDEKAEMKLEQLDSDPSHAIIANNPHQNILMVQGQGLNHVVLDMINFLLTQAQRATRFSDIMTGNQQGSSATATQINGQLAQGSVGIADKKSEIELAMAWLDKYCLNLCLEKWDIPFWTAITRKDGQPQFIDVEQFAKAPAAQPLSSGGIKSFMEKAKNAIKKPKAMPGFETVKGKDGQPEMIDLDFDVKVKLTSAFPQGKNDRFNQILSLMQIQQLDPETGRPIPFLTMEKGRELMQEITGFKFQTDDQASKARMAATSAALPGQSSAGQVNPLSNSGEVAMPNGARTAAAPSNLMGTVPGAGSTDKRGMNV